MFRRLPRPVACRELGIIYPSASAAAADLRLDPVTLNHAAAKSHGMLMYGGLTWDYVEDLVFRDGFSATRERVPTFLPGPFTGRQHSPETKTRMSVAKMAKRVPVVAIDETGRVVHRFESRCAAARAGHGHGNIGEALRNPNRRHHGLFWRRAK
jgi:hypothetical protein